MESKKIRIDKWNHGKTSTWKFKVYYSEVDNMATKLEDNRLKGEKHELLEIVHEASIKMANLENKTFKSLNSPLTQKKKFKNLAQKLIKMQRKHSKTRGPEKNKEFKDYSARHQARIRGQLTTDCSNNMLFLDMH